MRINALLPIAGVVGGIYSAGFLFGYNYHKSYTEEESRAARESSPRSAPSDLTPQTEPEKPHETLGTNPLIYKFGLPVAGPTLHYSNHVLLYDQVRKIPRWVAETLTEHNLKGDADRRRSNFTPDPNIPKMFRAGNEDFRAAGRGWSRGHMAPAGNMKQNQDAMDQTFLLSNILPQDYENNAGFWNRLEMYCRELTKRWNEVHVISGPVLRPTTQVDTETQEEKKFINYRVVGDKEVAVPTHLYKIVLCQGRKEGELGKSEETDAAIGGFMVPNEGISWSKDLRDFQLPINEIERVSGLTFYPQLDRQRTVDLCQADTCNLIKYGEFQLWIIGRQVGGSTTKEQLQAAWKKLESKNLEPDEYLQNLLKSKCEELGVTMSDISSGRTSESHLAGG